MTKKELKNKLSYDKDTGVFRWKVSNSKRDIIGNSAGTLSSGYIRISIQRKMYGAHRLAWLYTYGEFPKNEIDHINHVRNDNRINNLRSVTRSENSKNVSIYKNNTSGAVGVYWNKKIKMWSAQISTGYKYISLGSFLDIKDAIKKREKAKIKYGYHPNHA